MALETRQAQAYFLLGQASMWKHKKNDPPFAASASSKIITPLKGSQGPAKWGDGANEQQIPSLHSLSLSALLTVPSKWWLSWQTSVGITVAVCVYRK